MGYDTAQICLNGHVSATSSGGALLAAHCTRCGERNIIACEDCRAPIEGDYRQKGLDDMSIVLARMTVFPKYCHKCGKPYPWTKRRLEAAKEMAEEFSELDRAEKEKLKQSLDDLVSENPKTELAAVRFKRIMQKVGTEGYSMMKEAVTSVLSEAAKKILFGP